MMSVSDRRKASGSWNNDRGVVEQSIAGIAVTTHLKIEVMTFSVSQRKQSTGRRCRFVIFYLVLAKPAGDASRSVKSVFR